MKAPPPLAVLAVALLAGCAAELPPAPPPLTGAFPARDTAPAPRVPPKKPAPPPARAKVHRIIKPVWAELPSGLKVATIASKGQPLVHVRLVIEAGRAADGERPGLAEITAGLVASGGGTRLTALGAELSVDTGFDAATIALSVSRDHLAEALDLLAALVQRPQITPADLDRLKKQETERLAGAARTDGAWGASVVLHRDLFSLPSEHHPYATWSPTPEDLQRITLASSRTFHRRFYVPRNVFVVVAGDTTPEAATALAKKAFHGFKGGEPPALSFTDPTPPEDRKITLVDLPGTREAQVFVGMIGPARTDKSFASFAVAGRLLDARVTELAHGPSVLTARAAVPASETGHALQALLDRTGALVAKAPREDEIEAAQRALIEASAVRLDTPGGVTGEVARLHTLGLPDDHLDAYRKEIDEITPALASKAASDHLRAGHEIVVVAGDASVVGTLVAHFGEVKVVDPTRSFARVRTIPMAPTEAPKPAHTARAGEPNERRD